MQTKALVILNFLDDIDKQAGSVLDLKRAFLSSGMAEPKRLFPEEFGESTEVKDITEVDDDENVNFDYSEVTWRSGGDAFEEYQNLLAKVNAMQHGHMTADTLAQRPEWTEWR